MRKPRLTWSKTIPFVSVLIVNYNGKEFIAECVDSVLQTDYPKFEIVLVDNGSTDQSVDYVTRRYRDALRSKKIRLIKSKTNLYFTGGSNLAAKEARGEKLIFLNSDTIATKAWIKELVKCYQTLKRNLRFRLPLRSQVQSREKQSQLYLIQPKILLDLRALCHPEFISGSDSGQARMTKQMLKQVQHDRSCENIIDNAGGRYIFPGFGFGIGRGEKDKGQYDQTREIDFANGTCFMLDKNFFEKLGGFDESFNFFYEDVDLNLRAKKIGGNVFCCGKSVIYHKVSQTFKKYIPEEEMIFYARKNRLQTIIKNFVGIKRWARVFVLLILYIGFIIKDFFYKPRRSFVTIRAIQPASSFLSLLRKWWLFSIIYHTLIIKRTFKNWREYILDCFGLVKNKYSFYRTNYNITYKVRSNTIDLGILDEVLIKKIYDKVELPIEPEDTIIDVGAYTGITSLHFARWTKDRVIALEPEKENFQLLKENIAFNKAKNIIPLHRAISSKSETKELYLSPTNPAAHSLFLKVGMKTEKVTTITLKEIVKQYSVRSIGLLKIDCEGCEYDILTHCPKQIFTISKNIILEYHQIDKDHNASFLKQLLEKNGFSVAITSFPYNIIYALRI